MMSFFGTTFYGQNCKPCNEVKLKANGPDLLESKIQIKYGTPLCIEVDGVNVFLMKSYATYKPINFDFNVKAFLDQKLDKSSKAEPTAVNALATKPVLSVANEGFQKINDLQEKIFFNESLINEFITDSLSSNLSKEVISFLLKSNQEMSNQIKILEDNTSNLIQANKKLEDEILYLKNISVKSQEFKQEFILFQKSVSNVNKYTTLKNILLTQIKKDSVFIGNADNFRNRSKSTFKAIYESDADYLQKKNVVTDNLDQIDNYFIKLVQLYEQLNTLNKKKDLKLSGELKDGENILKFEKISASFETKYLFQDEMKKVKIISDSLSIPSNRNKIIEECYAGIDLYDEIQNATFKTTIISDNVYDDSAKIKPQLKNNKGKVMYEYREFKVSSYGNLKMNGSAGYFLNFISDDNYQLRKKTDTDATSKTGVSENNTDVLKHSLGGLLHAYYNCKGSVDAGFSVGLSINDNANAGFYLGASAFFTETNRLVLTSGISFIKVKRLNNSNLVLNTATKEYDFSNATDTEITYDNVYQPSFFVGISYNLF